MRRKRLVKLDPKKKVEQASDPIPPRAAPPQPSYPPGSAHARRHEIVEETAVLRQKIKDCTHCARLREEIRVLVEESESLLIKAVEETEASEGRPTTRAINVGKLEKEVPSTAAPSNAHTGKTRLLRVGKGKRKCSLCHEPGHQARHCPNAHVIQKQKKAKAAVKEERAAREAALKPGQRACSICRRPGHRAKNCPERES